MRTVGIIGGSGLYELQGLRDVHSIKVETPWGDPSDNFLVGTLDDTKMVFLPRHGRGHRIMPSEINFRANIYGMKKLGVQWIISVYISVLRDHSFHHGQKVIYTEIGVWM